MTNTIYLTEKAAQTIDTLIKERNLEDHGLRVFVQGGGCSGMEYGMNFMPLSEKNDTDLIVNKNGINVIVDQISLQYLHGAQIDYIDSLMGGGFRIDNPNAVSSCGCGSSFRADNSYSNNNDDNCCSY